MQVIGLLRGGRRSCGDENHDEERESHWQQAGKGKGKGRAFARPSKLCNGLTAVQQRGYGRVIVTDTLVKPDPFSVPTAVFPVTVPAQLIGS